jgi:ribosomal protein L11 methyltransferase
VEAIDVPEVDWVARFREGFSAFRVGGFLIAPCWDVPATPERAKLLIVDPGRAFGTGTHESTRLCLIALESLPPAERVLDLGAGSAILALAAARLGARSVVACDIDPEAAQAARRHAALNGVPLAVVQCDLGGPFRDGAFSLVLANLTAPLLIARSRDIRALAGPGGTLVLSGFLREEADGVIDAYAASGDIELRVEGEWAAAVIRMWSAPPSPRSGGGTGRGA